MTEFPVNPERRDPYPNFKFRVKWDGNYIPGISRVSGLCRTTGVIAHREGGDPSTDRKAPGRTEFDAIVLERGLTQDLAFQNWVNDVWSIGATPGSEVSLNDFRKEIYIELYNEAGQLAMAWNVYRCWPSEYALHGLDANTAAAAVEQIRLENEGWERDPSVVGPPEPKTNNG
jgi:phage tail-like protein